MTFNDGPLQDALASDVSSERPFASTLTLLAPDDDRETYCDAMWLGQ